MIVYKTLLHYSNISVLNSSIINHSRITKAISHRKMTGASLDF
jgi:hypothetical protein